MMFIRDALITDLEGITDCAKRFFKYANFESYGLPLDDDSFKEMVTGYIEDGICLLLMDGLYVAGGVAGRSGPWGFNKSISIFLELFYWVDEKYRGIKSLELFKQYEKRVKASGAKVNMMVSMNTHLQGKINNLYQRTGYKPFEQFHIKTF